MLSSACSVASLSRCPSHYLPSHPYLRGDALADYLFGRGSPTTWRAGRKPLRDTPPVKPPFVAQRRMTLPRWHAQGVQAQLPQQRTNAKGARQLKVKQPKAAMSREPPNRTQQQTRNAATTTTNRHQPPNKRTQTEIPPGKQDFQSMKIPSCQTQTPPQPKKPSRTEPRKHNTTQAGSTKLPRPGIEPGTFRSSV